MRAAAQTVESDEEGFLVVLGAEGGELCWFEMGGARGKGLGSGLRLIGAIVIVERGRPGVGRHNEVHGKCTCILGA